MVEIVEANQTSKEEYIRKVLTAYCNTPGTTGTVRRQDRLLAASLHDRGVPLIAVENALVLATARRLRFDDSPPLPTIRSLAYFSPVIDEVLSITVSQDYYHYLRHKIQRITQTPKRTALLPKRTIQRRHASGVDDDG